MTTHSTILQWMISRTKKRLSKTNSYVIPAYIIALSGLLVVCAYIIQAIRPAPSYGVVYSQLPVMHEPIADPLDIHIDEFETSINEKTPVAILQLDSFVFGYLNSFTKEFYRADNKFKVPHENGAPHLGKLLETYQKWHLHVTGEKAASGQTLILYPVSEMPMPIVIKVVQMLKNADEFSQVVLATDIL